MICPDCGEEVDYLSTDRKTGEQRCRKCAQRKCNSVYNKRKYIPKIKSNNKTSNIVHKEENHNIMHSDNILKITLDKHKLEDRVSNDIKQRFDDLKIKEETNILPLNIILEAFNNLCSEESIVTRLQQEKDIYDTLISDYLHRIKNTDNADEAAEVGVEISQIQKYRTPISQELYLYDPWVSVFNYIKKDKALMTIITMANEEYTKRVEKANNPTYVSSTKSMQKLDYVTSSKTPIIRKLNELQDMYYYKCSVSGYNFYRNKHKTIFELDHSIVAPSLQDAKNIFKSILTKNFATARWNEKDIEIKEVENEE